MQTAKLFRNGSSQAVRLPRDFRFEGDEVVVKKLGDAVVLFPTKYDAGALCDLLGALDDDFALTRDQPCEPQTRRFGD